MRILARLCLYDCSRAPCLGLFAISPADETGMTMRFDDDSTVQWRAPIPGFR